VDFVLRNTITDEELWRYENVNDFIIPMADWSKDGNRILLGIIPRRPSSNPYPDQVMLASLTIDELKFEVLSEPSFVTNREHFWNVEWSPDTRYALFELASPQETTNLFYVLDTNDSTTYQICEPGILEMWWLPEINQLLYIIQLDEGQALKLLDIESWQTQNLMQTDQDLSRYTNFIGWTPIEFNEP
jgi:hypothetical protein